MLLALLVLLADAASLMAAGDKAYAAKDFRTALFAYQDATREDPSSAIVLVKLADTYARMGHDPEAIEYFTRALKLDRGNSPALQGLAAARERLAILSPPKPAEPPPPKIVDEVGARERYTAAVKMINDRKYAESLPVLDEALLKKPGYGVALVARGGSLARLAALWTCRSVSGPRPIGQGRRVLPGIRREHRTGRAAATSGLCGAQCAGARKSLDFPGTCRGARVRRRKRCAAAAPGLCLRAQP